MMVMSADYSVLVVVVVVFGGGGGDECGGVVVGVRCGKLSV